MAVHQPSWLCKKHPELFNPTSYAAGRQVPMEVLNVSMPRTGTSSMQVAFTLLGIPSFHTLLLSDDNKLRDLRLWNAALEAKYSSSPNPITRADWDVITGSYSGICSELGAIFAPELIAAYPEAKVVLVERELEAWYKSYNECVVAQVFSAQMWAVGKMDPGGVGQLVWMVRCWARGWCKARNAKEMRGTARALYVEHARMVKRITPKERLLVMKLGAGWAPLCEFLGKEVPGEGFPRVNDSKEFGEAAEAFVQAGMWRGAKRVAMVVGPVVVLVGAWWLST